MLQASGHLERESRVLENGVHGLMRGGRLTVIGHLASHSVVSCLPTTILIHRFTIFSELYGTIQVRGQ